MQYRFHVLLVISMVLCWTCAPRVNAAVAISASGDGSQPSQTTNYVRSGPGFVFAEDVVLDPLSGPWQKNLINNQNNASGVDVPIKETLTNVGTDAWTDWHEQVLSTTTFTGTDTQPGFLFDHNSLVVEADYGAGLVLLNQGVEYTVSPTVYSGPSGSGNDNNWVGIDLYLAPGFEIAPGNRMQIAKNIFEVFLDGNIWNSGEAALVGEFPTIPEPTGVALGLVVGSSLLASRQPRRRRAGPAPRFSFR